jgi:hypothetical protein
LAALRKVSTSAVLTVRARRRCISSKRIRMITFQVSGSLCG